MTRYPRWLRLDGRRISYRDVGDGPAILLLHGLGHSLDGWRKVMLPLANPGYRVLAIDLPGFGWSDPPPQIDLETYVATLRDWLDLHCLERVALVGNSMGGLVAAAAAAALPERTAALVLVDPAGYGQDVPWVFRLASTWLGSLVTPRRSLPAQVRRALRYVYADPSLIEDAEVEHILATVSRPEVWATLQTIGRRAVTLQGMRPALGLGPLPPPAPVPTLVVWGERDRLLPISHLEAVRAHFPEAEVTVFSTSGHCPQLEVPEEFVARVRGFLESAGWRPADA